MIDWKETPEQTLERAARRAIEAISRVHTIGSDVNALSARVSALEGVCDDLFALVETLIEGRG